MIFKKVAWQKPVQRHDRLGASAGRFQGDCCGCSLYQQANWFAQSYALKKTATLIYDLSALIHEQQKERGATSVFLAGNGVTFGQQLRDQHALTDREMADLRIRLEEIGRESMRPELQEAIDTKARNS